MKELSIEEKAKRYDNAFERAKDFQKVNGAAGSAVISEIFPELVENESKDEQLRKNCIHFLELQKSHHAATFEIEECIDWLEKQKEPEDKGEISDGYHTFNELYRYRMLYNAAFFNLLPKEIVHKSKRHHDGEECFGGGWFIVMANLPTGQISNHYELKDWDLFQIPEKEVADEWDGHTPQEAAERLHEYLLEKQGEQNLANSAKTCKDEPKFKAGDWVIDKQGIVHKIANVAEIVASNIYGYVIVGGGYFNDNTEGVRRWTIEDAKEGDVLASGEVIFVFNNIHDYKLNCKCSIHKDGSVITEPYDLMTSTFFSEVYPATKEQREFLFAKMKEAGYEWDCYAKRIICSVNKSLND